jgi:hypothetical protein
MVGRPRTTISDVQENTDQINSQINSNSQIKPKKSREEIIRTLQKAHKIKFKLDYANKDPNYRYYWASGENPHRITDLEENRFYEKVRNERGGEVKIYGGVTSRGYEYYLYLMRVPNEIYDLSKEMKEEALKEGEKDIIGREKLEGLSKKDTYVPEGLETIL